MLIVHKCQTCGHPDSRGYREGRYDGTTRLWPNKKCGQSACHPLRDCDWGEPHTVPTYAPDTTVEDHLWPPGEPWANTGITACGCDQCKALHAQQTAGASA